MPQDALYICLLVSRCRAAAHDVQQGLAQDLEGSRHTRLAEKQQCDACDWLCAQAWCWSATPQQPCRPCQPGGMPWLLVLSARALRAGGLMTSWHSHSCWMLSQCPSKVSRAAARGVKQQQHQATVVVLLSARAACCDNNGPAQISPLVMREC